MNTDTSPTTDRMLSNWGEQCTDWAPPPPGSTLCIGVDHGASPGPGHPQQSAILVAVSTDGQGRPKVWILNETISTEPAAVEADAAAILDMVAISGLDLDDVDEWIGGRSMAQKRNSKLRAAVTAMVPGDCDVRIKAPVTYRASVWHELRFMNSLMAADGNGSDLLVSPAAVKFRQACSDYRGEKSGQAARLLSACRMILQKHMGQVQ